ncbi:MAG TPA: GntR family transcriptional regulator [Wenzhouxiangellaceae bacterium]|nr:GntR family transcriptional regulator [Wenzhouxiangellaceae bacterium]
MNYALYMPNVQTPSLTVDVDSDVSIVQQIVNGLRGALVRGDLAPGDSLPSSRALGRDLGVHFNTVAQAYRMLEAEGWLALKRRAGTVVRERPNPALEDAENLALTDSFKKELLDLRTRYQALGVEREALDSALEDLIETRRISK